MKKLKLIKGATHHLEFPLKTIIMIKMNKFLLRIAQVAQIHMNESECLIVRTTQYQIHLWNYKIVNGHDRNCEDI